MSAVNVLRLGIAVAEVDPSFLLPWLESPAIFVGVPAGEAEATRLLGHDLPGCASGGGL